MLASTFVLVGDHYQLPPLVQVHILGFPSVFGVENFLCCFHLHLILTDMEACCYHTEHRGSGKWNGYKFIL